MVERRNWTEQEVRKALALYLRTSFGRFHQRNPDVIALALDIGRTASAVALKLVNLAALDDSLPRKGMANASATDRAVWQAFLKNPDTLSISNVYLFPERTYGQFAEGNGVDIGVQSTRRVGQDLFRAAILTSYQGRCAITGIDDPRLLNASHIVGWSEDNSNRMNLRNGICLGALHDRAFDRHLITFDTNWQMVIRRDVPEAAKAALLRGADKTLRMPERFLPDPDLLARHRQTFTDAA
jgi:putative restriction endonuclease